MTASFTKKTFATKQELLDYVASRQAVTRDDLGRPVPHPAGTDDLLRFVGYSYGEQPDGTWMLVF